MATHVARGHSGDGGDRGDPNRIPTICEESQPTKRKVWGKAKNLNLFEKFAKGGNKKLSIEFDRTGNQYKFTGDNCSMFRRLISSEVKRVVPCLYDACEKVLESFKTAIFETLNYYFDLESHRDTRDWIGITRGI